MSRSGRTPELSAQFAIFVDSEPTPLRMRQTLQRGFLNGASPVVDRDRRESSYAARRVYWSGDIQPHIPSSIVATRHKGTSRRETVSLRAAGKRLLLPEGKPLRYRGLSRSSQGYIYRATETMSGMSAKKVMYPGLYRKLFCSWQEPARQATRALAGTPAYKHLATARYKVEALSPELKQQIKLRRVRLRRLWNVAEQFHLAATAQNLKRLVRHLDQKAIARTQH